MKQQNLVAALLEENLEDLYEHAPCGYISTFPDGTFAKLNHTFRVWTGYEPETLIGRKRFQDLLTLPGRMLYETHLDPLLRMQGFVREVALDIQCSDGRILPVFINTIQYSDQANTPVLNRTTLFDASDRRSYERELQAARLNAEQALELRDQFLAMAAQELRTPVMSILGNLQLIQRHVHQEFSLGVRDQRVLQIAVEQTTRLTHIIESMLDISRIETGHLALERASVDLLVLLYRLVDEMQVTDGQHIFEVRYLAQSATIQGDELRLEQVFRNLLDNAVKYSPAHSYIIVTIRQFEQYVHIEVRDNGMGIPADAIPHLFQRFYRAPNVQAATISGMGIGLYVAKEIIDLHAGTITVTSTEGQGCVVTVRFPVSAAVARQRPGA